MCKAIYAVIDWRVKSIFTFRYAFRPVIAPFTGIPRNADQKVERHNPPYTRGEICFTAHGRILCRDHARSLMTRSANSIRSSTRSRDLPAAMTRKGSSGSTLVQWAGSDVRCPFLSR